jgi:hypothetical protein
MSPTRRELLVACVASAAGLAISRSVQAARYTAGKGSIIKGPGFRLVEQPGERLQVLEGDAPVLTYNWGDQLKEGVPADRTRSCYIHPVWGMDGEVLTDDFPKDHYHHRGLSWMWNRVRVGGREVDIWTLKGIRQKFSQWLVQRADEYSARLLAENHWVMDGQPVAKETVEIYAFPAEKSGRTIDISLTLESLGQPIELLGEITKGYGGLCLRFAPREETMITTPAGRQAKDSDHLKFPWADLSGRFGGRRETSGAAIFAHPTNPGEPHEWTLRHYGFLGPNWPGMTTATLQPKKPVTLQYRIWVHRGDAAAGGVGAAYGPYANPGLNAG